MKLVPWPCTQLEFDTSNPSGNASLGCSGDKTPAQTATPFVRQTTTLHWPRFLCGGMLLTAAGLKGLEVVNNPLASGPLFGARWEYLVVVETELVLGLALVLGLYPAVMRWLAISCFLLFAGVSLYQLLAGASSCGCFGQVRVHPAYTLVLDLAAIVALGCWRTARTVTWAPGKVVVPALGGMVLLLILALVPSTAETEDLDSPGGVAVLDPLAWVGRPFPLQGHLAGGGDLSYGEWVVANRQYIV